MTDRQDVYAAIDRERDHQRRKWGDRPHSVQGWLLVAQAELDEAKQGWVRTGDDAEALRELLQVAAVCVACLERHGIAERPATGVESGQEGQ